MKTFIFYLIGIIFLASGASTHAATGTFTYQYKERREKGFNLELYQLTRHFEDHDYGRLTAFSSGNIPFLHVDEVLSSDNGTIFIKMGLIAPTDIQQKIIELKSSTNISFFLYHTKEASIAFFNLSESQVKELITGLSSESMVLKSIKEFILPSAYADIVHCSSQLNSQLNSQLDNPFKNLDNASTVMMNSLLYKRIGECAANSLQGAEGALVDMADFFRNLANNPTALWEDVKKNYEGLKSFVKNFSQELQSLYQTMSQLSIDDKLDIACTLTGQVVASLGMSLTGAGVVMGGGKLIASVIPKLMRMQSLLIQFQRFKIPLATAKESLSCAL